MLNLPEDLALLVREFAQFSGLLFETGDRQVAVCVDPFDLVVVLFGYRDRRISTFFGLFLLDGPGIQLNYSLNDGSSPATIPLITEEKYFSAVSNNR